MKLSRSLHLHCFAVLAVLPVFAARASAQSEPLPDAPSFQLALNTPPTSSMSSSLSSADSFSGSDQASASQQQKSPGAQPDQQTGESGSQTKILPQQKRVFGVLTNYTAVSGGTRPKPAGWKTDSEIAWKQSTDYTAIGFSVITSAIAYGQDTHPSLSTVNGGDAPFWAYTWRGFADKTDQVVQGSLFFPALLHEDTRYYAMGTGSKWKRTLNALGSVVIARNYSGHQIPNVAGLAGKAGTQAVSKTYYPAGSEEFGVLARKFAYACLRQAGFTVLREFSPDLSERLHIHVKGSN